MDSSSYVISFDVLAVSVIYLTSVSTFAALSYDRQTSWFVSIPVVAVLIFSTWLLNNTRPLKQFIRWRITPLKFLIMRSEFLYSALSKFDIFKFCNEFYPPERRSCSYYVSTEDHAAKMGCTEVSMVWQWISESDLDWQFRAYGSGGDSSESDAESGDGRTISSEGSGDHLSEGTDDLTPVVLKLRKMLVGSDLHRNCDFDHRAVINSIRSNKYMDGFCRGLTGIFEGDREVSEGFKKELLDTCYGEHLTRLERKNCRERVTLYENGVVYAHKFAFFKDVYTLRGHAEGKTVTVDIFKGDRKMLYSCKEYKVTYDNLMSNYCTLFKNLEHSLIVHEGIRYTHCPDKNEIMRLCLNEPLCHCRTDLLLKRGSSNTA